MVFVLANADDMGLNYRSSPHKFLHAICWTDWRWVPSSVRDVVKASCNLATLSFKQILLL